MSILHIMIKWFVLISIIITGVGLSYYFYKKNQKKEKKIQYGISGIILYSTYLLFSIIQKNYNLNSGNVLNSIMIMLIVLILILKIILKQEKIINKKIDVLINFILPIILFIIIGIKIVLKF